MIEEGLREKMKKPIYVGMLFTINVKLEQMTHKIVLNAPMKMKMKNVFSCSSTTRTADSTQFRSNTIAQLRPYVNS